jgi:hypothetical protein
MKLDPNQFMTAITNSVTRRMDSLFPGYFSNAKHDHYGDFGYPYNVDDTLLRHVYRRNSLARAAVVKTVDKVWQDMPVLREKESAHAETRLERRIRQHMQLIRGWQMLKVSNERALVSGWSATILLLEDGESLSAPVSPQVGADITFLAGMLPVWANQLQPVEWERNENSPTYGQPTMYMLTEQPLPDQMQRSTSQPSRKVRGSPRSRSGVVSRRQADRVVNTRSGLQRSYRHRKNQRFRRRRLLEEYQRRCSSKIGRRHGDFRSTAKSECYIFVGHDREDEHSVGRFCQRSG